MARKLIYGPRTLAASTTEFSNALKIPQDCQTVAFYGKTLGDTSVLDAATAVEVSYDGGTTWQSVGGQFTTNSNDLVGVSLAVNWGILTLSARRAAGSDYQRIPATHVRLKLVTGVGVQIDDLRIEAEAF